MTSLDKRLESISETVLFLQEGLKRQIITTNSIEVAQELEGIIGQATQALTDWQLQPQKEDTV